METEAQKGQVGSPDVTTGRNSVQLTLEPCAQLPTCITQVARRAGAGLSCAGMETGPGPLNHEEGKRVVRDPQGQMKDAWAPGAAQSCSPQESRAGAGAGRLSRARGSRWSPSLWLLLPRDLAGDCFPRNIVFKLEVLAQAPYPGRSPAACLIMYSQSAINSRFKKKKKKFDACFCCCWWWWFFLFLPGSW